MLGVVAVFSTKRRTVLQLCLAGVPVFYLFKAGACFLTLPSNMHLFNGFWQGTFEKQTHIALFGNCSF